MPAVHFEKDKCDKCNERPLKRYAYAARSYCLWGSDACICVTEELAANIEGSEKKNSPRNEVKRYRFDEFSKCLFWIEGGDLRPPVFVAKKTIARSVG